MRNNPQDIFDMPNEDEPIEMQIFDKDSKYFEEQKKLTKRQ